MYASYNPNPTGKNVGDCTVRAMSKALGLDWETAYWALCAEGGRQKDMPSSNAVWGAYLRKKGFRRQIVPDTCPDCFSVRDFLREHPDGVYILALSGHVVCVKDGVLFDSWDSSNEPVLYFWEKE